MSDKGIRLYDPTADPPAASWTLAPRVASLAGTRPGILDNGKPNAGILMQAVAKALAERCGAGEPVTGRMPIYGPPPAEVLDRLAERDFVIVGSAD